MRSKLFVPGSRPELFAKALASTADALSFDLEDAVPNEAKAQARQHLRDFLKSDAASETSKTIIVRINPLGSEHYTDDLAALQGGRIDLVNLPKVETPAQVGQCVDALQRNDEFGAKPAQLLLTIETPRGLRKAASIAAAHPRVAGIQLGLNDLFISLGVDRNFPAHQHTAMWQLRLAAGEAGCFAYDGSWVDLKDQQGLRAEAMLAKSLGYLGKSCIHPKQVEIVNAVFDRTDALADAQRLVSAANEAASRGLGAFLFEGRMIDRPAIADAQAILERARVSQ